MMIYQVFVPYDSQACAKATRVTERRCADCWTKQSDAVAATIYRTVRFSRHFKMIQRSTHQISSSSNSSDRRAPSTKRDGLKVIEKRGNGKKRNGE